MCEVVLLRGGVTLSNHRLHRSLLVTDRERVVIKSNVRTLGSHPFALVLTRVCCPLVLYVYISSGDDGMIPWQCSYSVDQ